MKVIWVIRNHYLLIKLTATERVSKLHFDLLINNYTLVNVQKKSTGLSIPAIFIWNIETFYLKFGYGERITQFCFKYQKKVNIVVYNVCKCLL